MVSPDNAVLLPWWFLLKIRSVRILNSIIWLGHYFCFFLFLLRAPSNSPWKLAWFVLTWSLTLFSSNNFGCPGISHIQQWEAVQSELAWHYILYTSDLCTQEQALRLIHQPQHPFESSKTTPVTAVTVIKISAYFKISAAQCRTSY